MKTHITQLHTCRQQESVVCYHGIHLPKKGHTRYLDDLQADQHACLGVQSLHCLAECSRPQKIHDLLTNTQSSHSLMTAKMQLAQFVVTWLELHVSTKWSNLPRFGSIQLCNVQCICRTAGLSTSITPVPHTRYMRHKQTRVARYFQ